MRTRFIAVLPILYFCGCAQVLEPVAEALVVIGVKKSQQAEIGRMVFKPIGNEVDRAFDQLGVDLGGSADAVSRVSKTTYSAASRSGRSARSGSQSVVMGLAHGFNDVSNAFFQSIHDSLPPPEMVGQRTRRSAKETGSNRF